MSRVLRLLLPFFFFVTVLLGWVRLLLTPAFLEVEYRRPGFPADPYGFTVEERLHWADLSRAYLLTDAGPEFFAPHRLADGSPLYNERELAHMKDVQVLVGQALAVWAASSALLALGAGYLFWKDRPAFRRTLADSGRFTCLFLLLGLAAVVLFWDSAFVLFHRVFFTGDTWLFPYSDTLIRLFPVTFWQDIFGVAAAGTALTGLAAWIGFRKRSP